MAFLSELAANASANNVGIVFFCGNDDAISGHRGTEGECFVYEVLALKGFRGCIFSRFNSSNPSCYPGTNDLQQLEN